jgi:NADH-quinone oxidoreductase subunit M
MLYLYRRVCYGDLTKDDVRAMPDLSPREMMLLVPLGLSVLWMGVYPESFLSPMRRDVQSLVVRLATAHPQGDAHIKFGAAPKPAAQTHEPAGEAH